MKKILTYLFFAVVIAGLLSVHDRGIAVSSPLSQNEHSNTQGNWVWDDASNLPYIATQEQNVSHTFREQSRWVQKLVPPGFAAVIPVFTMYKKSEFADLILSENTDYYIFALRKIRI